MAGWEEEEDYWWQRVRAIDVRSPKQESIKQKGKHEDLVIGDLAGYEEKMEKAEVFYQRTPSMEKPRYRTLDLRYRGQVVAGK